MINARRQPRWLSRVGRVRPFARATPGLRPTSLACSGHGAPRSPALQPHSPGMFTGRGLPWGTRRRLFYCMRDVVARRCSAGPRAGGRFATPARGPAARRLAAAAAERLRADGTHVAGAAHAARHAFRPEYRPYECRNAKLTRSRANQAGATATPRWKLVAEYGRRHYAGVAAARATKVCPVPAWHASC